MSGLAGALRALPVQDAFRRAGARLGGPRDWKEWLHFVVQAPGLHLIVNFSALDDVWGATDGPVEVGRVILLARTEGWDGEAERVESVRIAGEGLDARFGDSRVWWDGSAFRVEAAVAGGALAASLRLTPTSTPLVPASMSLLPGRVLSWLFVPRLRADGVVSLRGRSVQIQGAEAYHDHNWGRYLWGEDFIWDWISILPAPGSEPWSAVAQRVADRGRNVIRHQAMFVYRGADLVALFWDQELRWGFDGRSGVAPGLVLPPVMRLAAPGRAVDVPASVTVEATRGEDRVRLHFTPQDLAQVLVPDEVAVRGTTALTEVLGSASLSGRCGGSELSMAGAGILELVSGDRAEAARSSGEVSVRGEGVGTGGSVARSLRVLAAERPEAASRMCATLDGLAIGITVEPDAFVVRFSASEVEILPTGQSTQVEIRSDPRAILAVLDGELGLEEAVRTGAVQVRGRLDALVRARAGLLAYVEGAVRSPSFPALLDSYRASVHA